MQRLRTCMKRTVASGAILAGGLAGGLVAAEPAAAIPSCTSTSTVARPGFTFTMPSVGHNTGNLNCLLGVGNQSTAVRNLQSHLNLCYLRSSTVPGHHNVLTNALATDGIFGSRTRDAVAAVQQFHRIADDGVYGPQTRRTISFVASRDSDGRPFCRRFGA
jgi:peptidoglycan hydrolase-like protein with peptidoglycan-binding domain